MSRPFLIFLVSWVVLLGTVTTLFDTVRERDEQLRGYVDAAQTSDLPFRLPRLGVNAELTQYSQQELDNQLRLMEQAHIHWVRQFAHWDEIEPQKGNFQWDQWDTIVQAFENHSQLKLIVVFMNTPAWARASEAADNITSPPENTSDFASFAEAFARRYEQLVDYYQIWDEPNLKAAWGDSEPRPADYVALLADAYKAIHQSDANASVIAAALAPTVETGPQNINDISYLGQMYAVGAKPYMDAVAGKPYGFFNPPSDRRVSVEVTNFSRIIALHEEMLKNGDGAKAIWASNWGWNALPPSWQGSPSIWGTVSASEQITYTLDALTRAENEWPWLAGIVLQNWQPDAPEDDPIQGFAVIDTDNAPKPLWQALVNLPQQEFATNGLFPAVNPHAHYSGVWKFSSLGADIGWVQDSQLDFGFAGRSVSLLLRQGDYLAYLYPTVDGQPPNAVPQDSSGNAYIILTSPTLLPEEKIIPVATNLSSGVHSLHVVADRGWDRWALAGFAVSSGDRVVPFNRQISIAIGAIAVSGAAVLVSLSQLPLTGVFRLSRGLTHRLDITAQLIISTVTSLALMAGMLLTWGDGVPNIIRREPVGLGLAIITAGLIKVQPGFVVTVVALLVLFIIFYHRTEIGLTMTILWAPFFLFPVKLYNFAFPISEMMLLVTVASFMLRSLAAWGQNRQSRVSQIPSIKLSAFLHTLNWLDWGVVAWLLLGVVSLIWAQYRSEAVTELRTLVVEPALFYFIARAVGLTQRDRLRLIDALLIAGVVVALIGLGQFVQGQSIITAEEGARRLASVYGSPNNVGLFLGRCLPFLLAFVLVKVDKLRRILSALALVPISIALVLSQSVGAIFVGVPAAILAVLLFYGGRRARLLAGLFIVIGVVGFAVSLQSPRFARVLDFSSGTNFYRLRVWESALHVIHDHPITGLGLDQFLYAFRGRYILPDAWQERDLSHPHNIILDFWVRLGITGVAVLIGLQIGFWKMARQSLAHYRHQNPLPFACLVGIAGSMIDLLAHGLIDNSVYVQDLVYVFVLLLALIASFSNTRSIDDQHNMMV